MLSARLIDPPQNPNVRKIEKKSLLPLFSLTFKQLFLDKSNTSRHEETEPQPEIQWEGEVPDLNAGIGLWEDGHGVGRYTLQTRLDLYNSELALASSLVLL